MKAVVYQKDHTLKLEDVPEPRIESPTDAVLKIALCTICGSDLHIRDQGLQEAGKIIGHEYCGVIEDIGSEVHYLKKEDRVVGKATYTCGHCFYCQHQQAPLCENGGIFGVFGKDGAQAEYLRVPFAENSLIKIPDGLSFEDVLFTGDILSTGFSGPLKGKVQLGDTVAIFGAGPVGLASAATTPLFGASLVISVDILDYRLRVAQKFGAITINASKEDPVAKIKELTGGRGVDVGIEAAGFEPTFKVCMQSTRRGGRVVQLGQFVQPIPWDITERSFDIFEFWIGLGDLDHIPQLMSLIEKGTLDLKPLITHRFPLTEALRGYEVFEKKLENCIKVLLKP